MDIWWVLVDFFQFTIILLLRNKVKIDWINYITFNKGNTWKLLISKIFIGVISLNI